MEDQIAISRKNTESRPGMTTTTEVLASREGTPFRDPTPVPFSDKVLVVLIIVWIIVVTQMVFPWVVL